MNNTNLKDHRQLGQELELFYISDQVGLGLPLWLPKGAVIRRELEKYMTDLELSEGYQHVVTPHLAKVDLYKTSGHWEHYQDEMFPVMKRGSEEYVLRPMNCPHHIQIFKMRPRSYRELPLRIAEFGTNYRFEHSGELSGLIRVRSMTLNDAHIFCTPEQLKDEFKKVVKLIEKVYKDLDLKNFWFRLSLHDPKDKKKYVDNPKLWELSEQALRDTLNELKLPYKEGIGEAAFYGPKLDVQIPNALGKDETVSTVQIDFHLPERFHLTFVGEDGKNSPVVMVHRGIISTLERMIGFLLERYQGALPTWLSPIQVKIIAITERNVGFAEKILSECRGKNIRAEIDSSNEKMQSKIREASFQKIPYMLIIGDREEKDGSVTVRARSGEDLGAKKIESFLQDLSSEVARRV